MATFANELKTMIDVNSPRVVRVYGMCIRDPTFAGLVIEWCPGGDLRNRLNSDELLSYEQKKEILQDIATVQYPPLFVLLSLYLVTRA